MAKQKLSEMDPASALVGVERIECLQGGLNVYTTPAQLSTYIGGGGGAVDSVNGQTGVVVLTAGNVGADPAGSASTVNTALGNHIADSSDAHAASAITNTPAGNIAATNVQAAINELDTEKAALTQVIGIQDLFIPATAMWPRVTNGSANVAQFEMTTSLFNIQAIAFDQSTQEFAQFQIVLPRKWNIGTVTVVPYWTATSGTGTVQWGISGGAYSNDDALTVALGTAQTSDDTLLATNDLHVGPATSAITLAGTPASADFLAFQVSRNPASDTLNADALLLGISVRITTTAAIDA